MLTIVAKSPLLLGDDSALVNQCRDLRERRTPETRFISRCRLWTTPAVLIYKRAYVTTLRPDSQHVKYKVNIEQTHMGTDNYLLRNDYVRVR
jgi:hypothetical protein